MKKFTKLTLVALGALAGAMGGSIAAAADNGDVPSAVVKYSEQSLATDSGVKEVYRRIVRAAERVCPDPSFRDLMVQEQVAECRKAAVSRAIRQIDNARLAAVYAAHSKNG